MGKRGHLVICLLVFCFFGCGESSGSGAVDAEMDAGEPHPPRKGECGMEGQWVWCNEHIDCSYYLGDMDYCTHYGSCLHTLPGERWCQFDVGTGDYCWDNVKICSWWGDCLNPCETHEDCVNGTCVCQNGLRLCVYERCQDGMCPEGTVPVEGILTCAPEPGSLEGECHHYQGTCDATLIPVGEKGCMTP